MESIEKVSTEVDAILSPTETVMRGSDVRKFKELGLGKGVDGSKSDYCLEEISSVQIREVNADNAVITTAHAKQECYEDDICTEKEYRGSILASIDDPEGFVKCGMKANYNRATTDREKVIGYKIQTRRVTFKEEFSSLWLPTNDRVYSRSLSESFDYSSLIDYSNSAEDKFYKAILQCITQRQLHDKQANKPRNDKPVETLQGANSGEKLADYLKSIDANSSEMKEIQRACGYFVNRVGTTHYIYELELGAFENLMLNEIERRNSAAVGANVTVKHLIIECTIDAGGGMKKGAAMKETRKMAKGTIKDGEVSEEGVIGYKLKAVHTLLKHPQLRNAMKDAVKEYLQERAREECHKKEVGPFHISCMDIGTIGTRVYWKVGAQSVLVGTKDEEEASSFYFITSSETERKFAIATKIDDRNHYVKAAIPFGKNKGPLEVSEILSKSKYRYLTLHKNDGSKEPVNIHKDVLLMIGSYYFKRVRGSAYIAMETAEGASSQIVTKCVRRKAHHSPPKKSILFQIHQEGMKLKTRKVVDDGESSIEDIVNKDNEDESEESDDEDDYLPEDFSPDFSELFKADLD